MSTNEPKHEAPLPGKTEVRPEAWDDRQRVPAGLPDPAVLARMASEFFTSVPGFSQLSRNVLPAEAQALFVPTGPDPLANSWDVTELTARSDVSRPTEAELNALPSTLAGFSAPSSAPTAELPRVSIPGAADVLSAAGFSSVPTYSFLEEARPLFGAISGPLVSSATASAPATISPWQELGTVSPSVPNVAAFSSGEAAAAPLVPGAWLRPDAADRAASYGFLNEARQLSPADL